MSLTPIVIVFALASAGCGATSGGSATAVRSTTPPADPAAPTPAPSASAQAGAQTPAKPARPVDPATQAFLDRVREYATYHNNVEKMVPPLVETKDPMKIAAREQALGEALIKQRPNAQPGDFFIKQYQPMLVRIIQDDFKRRSVADRKALVQDLPKNIRIEVNTIYPTSLPLVTFPANLLEKLPELPKELEYRILGRSLILRDVTGNVIVDVVRDVFPIPS